MQATNEDKALEILRLIFSGRLDKENSKAVKQVADIIGRKCRAVCRTSVQRKTYISLEGLWRVF